MIEALFFIPGTIVLLIGLKYGLRFYKGEVPRSYPLLTLYFVLIFTGPFLGAYILEYILFPELFEVFIFYSLFGLSLSILTGLMAGLRIYMRSKFEIHSDEDE